MLSDSKYRLRDDSLLARAAQQILRYREIDLHWYVDSKNVILRIDF